MSNSASDEGSIRGALIQFLIGGLIERASFFAHRILGCFSSKAEKTVDAKSAMDFVQTGILKLLTGTRYAELSLDTYAEAEKALFGTILSDISNARKRRQIESLDLLDKESSAASSEYYDRLQTLMGDLIVALNRLHDHEAIVVLEAILSQRTTNAASISEYLGWGTTEVHNASRRIRSALRRLRKLAEVISTSN